MGLPSLIVPTSTNATPSLSPTPTEPPDVYNFLLLGGDHRRHRIGTDYGNKTDVIVAGQIYDD